MRVNFRQGIVAHQASFLTVTGSGGSPVSINLNADTRDTVITIAQDIRNYTYVEINDVDAAWSVPTVGSFWLYWDFNQLTFERTFGTTNLEPIAQSVEPGTGNAEIISIIPGAAGIGSFTVEGYYSFIPGRILVVTDTVASDGTYTVASATYDELTGDTTIVVNEAVSTIDGSPVGSPSAGSPPGTQIGTLHTDLDSDGNPQLVVGRHWYDTINNRHYVRTGAGVAGTTWTEVIRVFAARVTNSVIFPMSINLGSFVGTQIGNTNSVLSGRLLFDESSQPIIRDDGTFLTTEDQFYSAAARIDAVRLESNVARARFPATGSAGIAAAAYTVVSWFDYGDARVAMYNDIGTSVLGILTETVGPNEQGAVVIQGVVTNPAWANNDWAVGAPLWVNDEGELTDVDPHVQNVSLYPIGRVPVARVLDIDTVVFEQGLGGKGDRGPEGDVADVPVATTTTLGLVRLTVASSDPDNPIAVSDQDPRLSDAREPLAHTHPADDIVYVPSGDLSATDVQAALDEIAANKYVQVSGDTMTGFLTLVGDPVDNLHAVPKQYVDQRVSGLSWIDPICILNLIGDDVTDPSTLNPFNGDAWVMPAGTVGAWSTFNQFDIVQYDLNNDTWFNHGPPSNFIEQRFGIAFNTPTVPTGTFAGRKSQIAIYIADTGPDSFYTPTVLDSVYVCGDDNEYQYHQYVYEVDPDKNEARWVQFGGLTVGISSLQDLVDVLFPGSPAGEAPPDDGDVLVWDSATQLWTVQAPASGNNFQIIDDDQNTYFRTETTLGADTNRLEGAINVVGTNYTIGSFGQIAGQILQFGTTGYYIVSPSSALTGVAGVGINIQSGQATVGTANGGPITIQAGNGSGAGGTGGLLTLRTQDSDSGTTGSINIITGDVDGVASGSITLRTGDGDAGTTGTITLAPGQSFNAVGGDVILAPGEGDGNAFNETNEGSGTEDGSIVIARVDNNAGTRQGVLRFLDSGGSLWVGFRAPDLVDNGVTGDGNNTLWTLPEGDGAAGEALLTDGAGILSWGSGLPTSTTECNILVADNAGGYNEQAIPELPRPYDVAAQIFGSVPDNEIIFKFVSPQKFLLLDYGHQGSFERLGTLPEDTPNATTTFRLYVNDVQVGEFGFFQTSLSPITEGISIDIGNGWPNSQGNYLGSFVNIEVGDVIDIRTPVSANVNLDTIALTLRGIVEPAVACGTNSVAFDNDATINEFYGTGGSSSTIAMTFTGSIKHAEWSVIGYVPAANWPPVGSPSTRSIIPMGDDEQNTGSPGGNPSLTFTVPGVGSTVFSTNRQYVETGTLTAPTFATFTDGGYRSYYLIRCTVHGPAGTTTDVAWVRPD